MRTLFVAIMILHVCHATAAEFVADDPPVVKKSSPRLQDQAKTRPAKSEVAQIDFLKNSNDWSVSWPAPDRALLSNRKKKKYVLVVQYRSKISTADADQFLKRDFARLARKSRLRGLTIDKSLLHRLDADSAEVLGRRVGRVSFDLTFPNTSALFTERIWAENGRVWQISMVSLGAMPGMPDSHDRDVDAVMESILQQRKRHAASWLDFVMPLENVANAEPVSELAPGVGATNDVSAAPGLHMPTVAECAAEKIPDELRASPGLKFSLSMSAVSSCGSGLKEGFDKMVESTKAAFISGLQSVQKHTEENLKRSPCPEPPPLPPNAGWYDILWGHPQEEKTYSDCLEIAGTTAVMQSAGDMVSQTVAGVSALVNWVRTTEDPLTVIAAMVQSKVPSFMCVNADTQLKMYCEFIGAATTAVAAAAATGAVTGGVGALAGGATLAEAGTAALVAGSNAALATLASPYTVPRDLAKLAVAAPALAVKGGKVLANIAKALASLGTASRTIDANQVVRLAMASVEKGTKHSDVEAAAQSWIADHPKITAAEKQRLAVDIKAAFARAKGISEDYVHHLTGTAEENAQIVDMIRQAQDKGIVKAHIEQALTSCPVVK